MRMVLRRLGAHAVVAINANGVDEVAGSRRRMQIMDHLLLTQDPPILQTHFDTFWIHNLLGVWNDKFVEKSQIQFQKSGLKEPIFFYDLAETSKS